MLARVIYGFRISVLFGLLLTILSSIVGVTAGAVQGYFGGRVDLVFQRFLEIWSSIPSLFVLIIISSVLVPGFWTLLGVLLLFDWVYLVGVVRAEFLRGRNFEYITAARALGLSNAKIMFKHLLPNAMVATLTFLPFKLSGSIAALTALDFLGLGLPPGSPSLGELLVQGKRQPAGAVARPHRLLLDRRSCCRLLIFIGEARARRARPAQDVPVRAAMASSIALARRRPRPVGRVRAGGQTDRTPSTASRSRIGKGETVALVGEFGLRQDRLGAVDPAAAALSRRLASLGRDLLRRQGPAEGCRGRRCGRSAATGSRSSSRSR